MLASPTQLKALNPIHVLRGTQLAWLGLVRSLQNPELLSRDHFTFLIAAVVIGIGLKIALQIPTFLARSSVAILVVVRGRPTWENHLYATIDFAQHWVLSVPYLLLKIFRHMRSEPFDDLFMTSMTWVDEVHKKKHISKSVNEATESFSARLRRYQPTYSNDFYARTGKRLLIGSLIYACSCLPNIGGFVLPSVAFWTLKGTVGSIPALFVFSVAGLLLPKHVFVVILQTYFSTRSLTRQLLLPYFARVGRGFTHAQKAKWYREREGVLFGFSLPFFLSMRLPYVGVLVYGLAAASTAFLVSKVSGPPPSEVSDLTDYAEKEVPWTQGRRNLIKAGWEKVSALDGPSPSVASKSRTSLS